MGLKKRIATLALVALTAFSCIADTHVARPVRTGIRNATVRQIDFHADTAFKPDERAFIIESIQNLYQQSSGIIKATVKFDVDFESTQSVVAHAHDDLIMRTPSDAPYMRNRGQGNDIVLGDVDGVDLTDYHPGEPTHVFLIVDRITNADVFVHVVSHEILHTFGLRHVADPSSIMYGKITGDHPTQCMNESDAQELCRLEGCSIDALNWCK